MRKAVLNIIKNEKDETLFLLRKTRPFGWGLVGGKIDGDEDPKIACIRETFEETGIRLDPSDLTFVANDVSINGFPIIIFKTVFNYTPDIIINKAEHLNAKWIKTHNYLKGYTKDVLTRHFAGRTLDFINKDL